MRPICAVLPIMNLCGKDEFGLFCTHPDRAYPICLAHSSQNLGLVHFYEMFL